MAAEPPSYQKITLGVIEDDPDTILALQRMAVDLDLELIFVETTSQKLVEKISQIEPAILMVALHLTACLDGVWPAEGSEALPVIYMAAPAEEALLDPSMGSGYLLKPFSLKQLQLSIALALRQRQSAQALKQANERLHQAEMTLSQSKNRLQVIWDIAVDAMVLSDPAGIVLMVNPAYCRLYRLTPEQVIGQPFMIIFPAEQREDALQQYRSLFRIGTMPPVFQARIRRWDGVELLVESKATFVIEEGQRVAILSVIRDLTGREQANEQLHQRLEGLSLLNFVSRTLATVTDLQEALEIVAQTMTGLFKAHGTVVGLLSPGQSTLTLVVHHAVDHQASDLIGLAIPLDSTPLIAEFLRTPQSITLSQLITAASFPFAEKIFRERGLHAGMTVPLHIRGESIGLIGISSDQPGRSFTQAEISLAETVAGQIAGAIEITRLFDEERRQRRVAESLRRVTTILKGKLNERQLLAATLDYLGPIIRHDSGGVLLHEGDSLVLAGGLSQTVREHLGEAISLDHPSPVVRVFKNKKLLLINEGDKEPHWLHFPAGQLIQSWIGAPMMVDDQVMGVLAVSYREPGSYTEEDAQILQSFANQAALALHNARLFEALRQSEIILNETQKITKIGGWVLTLETQQLTWTEEVYHLHDLPLDYKPSLEKSLAFYAPSHLPLVREAMHKAISQGEAFDLELQLITAKGQRRWIRAMGKLQPEDDKPGRLFGTLQDVTERKRLEEQLLQSQKMEAVGQLAGGVAHHFNNMLMVITGYVELALESLSSDNALVADLRLVQKTAERAATLTQQLLTFTRRQMIQPKPINLNESINRTQLMLRQFINETIEFRLVLAPDLKQVSMDASQFEQLLVNLVVNARDAMPEGGRLTLQTDNVHLTQAETAPFSLLTPGDYVRLTISDTGVGMDDDVKAHIFEPFFTTKPVGQGTGLGLPTCLGIVQQHGGDIVVESEPGQGARLKIYLPFCEQPALPTPEEPRRFPPGDETILLVEDEAQVRELIARVLRQQGYQVLEADNGEEALQLILARPDLRPHLLLTDVVMPRLGGKALMIRLKDHYPDLKVLFISGYSEEAVHRQDEMLSSRAAFLTKPFTPAKLAQSVRAILDAHPD